MNNEADRVGFCKGQCQTGFVGWDSGCFGKKMGQVGNISFLGGLRFDELKRIQYFEA